MATKARTDQPQVETSRLLLERIARARAATPRAGIVAWMVAGVEAQYRNLRRTLPNNQMRVKPVETFPYRAGGWIERVPLPSPLGGTLRSTLTLLPLIADPDLDVLWSQVALPLLPFLVTRAAISRTPTFYAIDCTPALLHRFGRHYRHVTDPASPKGRLITACMALFLRRCTGVLPWSKWAAGSMIRDYGVAPQKVEVIAPGIDLTRWSPGVRARDSEGRLQLLFVGGDFERKGGPLLLEIFREHLKEVYDLHVVTRARLVSEPGMTVHSDLTMDSPALVSLYRQSDVLAIPTYADCFSIAAIEAMACGLPVVISDVGATPEIVSDGETGRLIEPGDGRALLSALRQLADQADLRRRWGAKGRLVAERRFNGVTQSNRTAEILVAAAIRARRQPQLHR